MRKLLQLSKVLLTAALIGVGASDAWADVPTYTWDFTNTTTWTTAKVCTGSAVTYDQNGVASDAGGYSGFGVTFNFAESAASVGKFFISNTTSYTILWWNTGSNGASASDNNVSISVPVGFKVTFNVQCTASRPMGYKIGSAAATTTTEASIVYTNETAEPVTIIVWGTNSDNGARRQNGIHNIVLEDYSAVAKHTWSATAYATISGVKTEIGSWNAGGAEYSEGEEYNVWAKKVITYGGHYYELDDAKFAANTVYFSAEMGDADAAHEITYTLNDDIVYYTEGEAWDTNSQILNSLVASSGQYVYYYAGTQDVDITDAGVYQVETNVIDRGSNSGLSVYNSEDTELAGFYRTGNGFKQTDAFYVAASSTIKVGISSGNTASIDYVLIRKVTEAADAIAYCKTCENSSDFATYIDGLYAAGSLTTAAQVYAAYNAWQVDQAVAASSTDYTKVMLNADFSTGNFTPWTIYGDAGSADSDNDKYGTIESNGAGGYQYYTGYNGRNVSQTITGLPAGVYRLKAKIYSWAGGAPVKIFANGQVSDAENGENHDMTIDFTVTGEETSIKVGVGGDGNGSGDNTWGTWGYRIDYFTLTKVASVSATLGANGYATFASAYPLDLTTANLPSGVTAYKAAVSGTTVTFTPLDQTVPANTGVLLKGPEDAEVSIPVVASGTDVTENAFLVNTAGTKFDAEAGYTYFGMKKAASSSDAITFATFAPATVAIPASKAYLKVLTSSIATAPSLTVVFDDGQTTGIESVKAEGLMLNGSAEFYNLAGQRVAQPTKGLYIVNGRKVVVK